MGLALEYQYKNTTLTSKGIRKYLILKQLCVQWPNNTQSPPSKKNYSSNMLMKQNEESFQLRHF